MPKTVKLRQKSSTVLNNSITALTSAEVICNAGNGTEEFPLGEYFQVMKSSTWPIF